MPKLLHRNSHALRRLGQLLITCVVRGLSFIQLRLCTYASGLQEYEDGLAELTDAKEELDRAGAELADAKAA